MSQLPLLEPAPETVKAFMCIWEPPCGNQAVLGDPHVNASGTCTNRTATCLKCGKQGIHSTNLTLTKGARKAAAAW